MNKLSHWASKAIETLKTCKDISKLGMLPDSEYSIHIANSSNYRLRIKGLVCLFKLGCRDLHVSIPTKPTKRITQYGTVAHQWTRRHQNVALTPKMLLKNIFKKHFADYICFLKPN